MRILEIFKIVILNMIENKSRLLLTTLGIIVGTTTIILVIAIGKGGEVAAAKQFSNLSADTVYVNLDYNNVAKNREISSVDKLNMDLIEKIIDESNTLQAMYLRASIFKEIQYKTTKLSANVIGVSYGYSEISNIEIQQGDDLQINDFEQANRLAIIGRKLAEKLFNSTDIIGETIKIGEARYKIIGLIKRSEEGLQGVDIDSSIFIPFQAAEKDKLIDKYANIQAVGQVMDLKLVSQAKQEIKSTLNYYMDDGNLYTVSDAGTRIETATASAVLMKTMLVAVAIIVFIVGGIGIMNVMFVTVKERTKEIGILKALGASDKDILCQFLIEAFCIGVMAGIIGVLLSYGFIFIIDKLNIPLHNTIDGPITALIFAIFTSTLFGFYPAYKASKLMPVEALSQD